MVPPEGDGIRKTVHPRDHYAGKLSPFALEANPRTYSPGIPSGMELLLLRNDLDPPEVLKDILSAQCDDLLIISPTIRIF